MEEYLVNEAQKKKGVVEIIIEGYRWVNFIWAELGSVISKG